MSTPRLFGSFAANGGSSGGAADGHPARDGATASGVPPAGPPLSELTVSFVPLAVVSEWTRCGETADFVARYFAHDYGDREVAGSVLSTVVNELVENAVKFSSDKTVPATLAVREYAERMTIVTSNLASPTEADAFGEAVTRLTRGDPESMFAERVANPPATGGAGIGLIMLRKDYGAAIGVRVTPARGGAVQVDVEVALDNREVDPS